MTTLQTPADFAAASLNDQIGFLYGAVGNLVAALHTVTTRLDALESKPSPTPKPATTSPPARTTSGARRPSRKERRAAAPTSTPTTGPPAPQSIRLATSQAALEKLVVTVSLADKHAGHVIGRAGTGLRQIHDTSRAKVSVTPTASTSGLRAVTIRGTAREVGDALTAIGKRLARRRVRTPRKKKQAPPSQEAPSAPTPAAAPPIVVVAPPPPPPPQTSTPATWAPRSGSASPHSPNPMAVDTRSGPSSSLPPGSPMDIGNVAPQRGHAVQTARRSRPFRG